MKTTFGITAALAVLAVPAMAAANPRPLPFTYPYETLPEGGIEVEQYLDATPVRTLVDGADGRPQSVFDQRYGVQTELEYGITDHLELGAYLVFEQDPNERNGALGFDGTKQRLRYRFAEEGELPVDVAIYGELAEFHDEIEFEEKVILGKRFGNLRLMANLWVEQEVERGNSDVGFVYNPTLGATYQVDPRLWLGVEGWAHGYFNDEASQATPGTPEAFNAKTHVFVGPAISLQFGRVWASVAPYFRLDDMARAAQIGDQYGKVWVRGVLGVEL